MKLKYLFSAIIALAISGCSTKEIVVKKVYIKSKCPELNYSVSVPKMKTFTIKNKNGKILISKQSFKELVDNYIKMKEELNQTNKVIDVFNKHIERINK